MSDYPHAPTCTSRLYFQTEQPCSCHVAELRRLTERAEKAEAALILDADDERALIKNTHEDYFCAKRVVLAALPLELPK